ncbi:hypothetical protein DM806_22270 [Sphingobium lactosutens]|uniref:hypothetical protein n=1 Tax=Sphingobium lactosutens TaxID=522773 RepID=UPI0015C165B5|nr:hypothetical protein [Sphingobium lactosutens]NWK98343.1 hypothetical protein [Sphingobium lactosutens]
MRRITTVHGADDRDRRGREVADEKFSLSVFGDNLLNEKYCINVSRQQIGGWYVPGAPITWGKVRPASSSDADG